MNKCENCKYWSRCPETRMGVCMISVAAIDHGHVQIFRGSPVEMPDVHPVEVPNDHSCPWFRRVVDGPFELQVEDNGYVLGHPALGKTAFSMQCLGLATELVAWLNQLSFKVADTEAGYTVRRSDGELLPIVRFRDSGTVQCIVEWLNFQKGAIDDR